MHHKCTHTDNNMPVGLPVTIDMPIGFLRQTLLRCSKPELTCHAVMALCTMVAMLLCHVVVQSGQQSVSVHKPAVSGRASAKPSMGAASSSSSSSPNCAPAQWQIHSHIMPCCNSQMLQLAPVLTQPTQCCLLPQCNTLQATLVDSACAWAP